MSDPILTLPRVVEFLTTTATEHDLDVVVDALRGRRAALAKVTAAAIKRGVTAKTKNLKPKYLSGLTGDVTEIESGRGESKAHLLLDENSSSSLDRYPGARRYCLVDPATGRRILHVPVTCLDQVS